MTKSEFIEYLSEKYPEITKKDMELVFDTIIGAIEESLKRGERIEIREFGNFVVRKKGSRLARNPKTGETVEVPEMKKIYFKVGKGLFEKINS